MATAAHIQNPTGKGQPEAFVVETAHKGLVWGLLQEHIATMEDADARLGLTLVTLSRLDDAAEAVIAMRRRRDPTAPRAGERPGWTSLDTLVHDLRAVFEADYNGWSPELGKNRFMHGVQFVTYPNAGGANGPTVPSLTDLDEMRTLACKVPPNAGQGVLVGLPDTRLSPHPDLTGRYFTGGPQARLMVEPVRTGKPLSYVDGHSTFLASLILSEAPAARLDVRPVLDHTADRSADRSVWDLAGELIGYLDSGVKLVNLSWACYTLDGAPPLLLSRAIGLLTPTILVIAAAGNHGSERGSCDPAGFPARGAPAYPAALPDVTAVGALDGEVPARFNPTVLDDAADGARSLAPWINVLAPGVDLVGNYLGEDGKPERVDVPDGSPCEPELAPCDFEGYAKWSGTSFAAAAVTGAVAARMTNGVSAREALERVLNEQAGGIRRT
jgi:membrane-anchored mycosin MYCP